MVAWLNSKIESITGAAVILAGASFASKILGLIRNRVLASAFGAGDTLDAYYAAFRIPDAIFQFVVLGALSAGFIPVFVELMEKQSAVRSPQSGGEQWRVAATILNALLIALTVFVALFIILAPQLQRLIAPGFFGEKLALTITLARIMALGPLFLAVSAVVSGILQSYRRFIMYALAPIFYNLGIIIGVVLLTRWMGVSGLAWGVVLGTILHMIVQLPAAQNAGFRFLSVLDLKSKAVRTIAWLSFPRLLGLAVVQLNAFAITILASRLTSGSLAVFNLANDIQSVPIGLFAVSLATAAFPALSEFSARADTVGFRKSISSTIRLILFLTIPVAILLLMLRAQIVRVLLGAGKFDWNDTTETADALAFFSMSLFAQALIPLMVRALYAIKDTISPMIAGVVSLAVNVGVALWLNGRFGVAGLAFAFSLAAITNVIMHWIALRRRVGSIGEIEIVPTIFKISVAGLAMVLIVQTIKVALSAYLDFHTGIGIFMHGFISGTIGLAVFLFVALALGSEEARQIKAAFSRRLLKGKNVRPVEIID